ncbi:MAG: membrane protein insertion efficiency factor YidD [Kiritimatiellia bacterium]
MRLTPNQQTLAISMASVLLCTAGLAGAANNTNASHLAWQLCNEGDWHHARNEALRAHLSQTNDPLSTALLHLTALRLEPSQTQHADALQAWLAAYTGHPQHDWIALMTEQSRAQPPAPRMGIIGGIARAIIGFYQKQIGPGIGQRCAMHPSCSHYSLEACRRYGLVGIPMTADRLIRESDHIRYRINPIQQSGVERYADPVTDHSQWFRRYRK